MGIRNKISSVCVLLLVVSSLLGCSANDTEKEIAQNGLRISAW